MLREWAFAKLWASLSFAMLFTVKKIIAYGVFPFAGVLLWANDSLLDNAVIGVEIPHFDEEGRLNWRLQAKEVLPAGENQYEAKDPILRTIAGFGRITDATTSEGVFNVRQGKARGQDTLMVRGDGFFAQGEDWMWQEKAEDGVHKMAFRKDGLVSFSAEEIPLFASLKDSVSSRPPNNAGKRQQPEAVKNKPAVAEADYIEMIALEEGGYRFLLEGMVSISGGEVEIACSQMEVFLHADTNSSSSTKFGNLKEIKAVKSVTLKQPGRVCHADRLSLNGITGVALLEGSAKVIDDLWGTASGEKIILERGNRRARIVKTEKGRPRLTFPEIKNFTLPFRQETSGEKP